MLQAAGIGGIRQALGIVQAWKWRIIGGGGKAKFSFLLPQTGIGRLATYRRLVYMPML